MKYVHKPIEVEAIRFTETEAKNPDSLAFSQFGIQDRSKTNSWSYWKTPESLTVPGRFFLRTKQHSTMMVAVGDWIVKDPTGHVTLMSDKRFNELYRPDPTVKSPPPEDWAEVIKDYAILHQIHQEKLRAHLAEQARQIDEKIMSNLFRATLPPSAIGAIIEAEGGTLRNATDGRNHDDAPDSMRYSLKGDFAFVHRTDSSDPKTGSTNCRDCGTCEGCKNDG